MSSLLGFTVAALVTALAVRAAEVVGERDVSSTSVAGTGVVDVFVFHV
jgi:hypothetical protein